MLVNLYGGIIIKYFNHLLSLCILLISVSSHSQESVEIEDFDKVTIQGAQSDEKLLVLNTIEDVGIHRWAVFRAAPLANGKHLIKRCWLAPVPAVAAYAAVDCQIFGPENGVSMMNITQGILQFQNYLNDTGNPNRTEYGFGVFAKSILVLAALIWIAFLMIPPAGTAIAIVLGIFFGDAMTLANNSADHYINPYGNVVKTLKLANDWDKSHNLSLIVADFDPNRFDDVMSKLSISLIQYSEENED